MYNIMINIIAWIAVIWFAILVFWHIVIFVWLKVNHHDCKYFAIKRTTYFSNTEFNNFYIIPSINCNLKGMYKNINLALFLWNLSIEYHLVDEKEEELEVEVRRKMNE